MLLFVENVHSQSAVYDEMIQDFQIAFTSGKIHPPGLYLQCRMAR